MSFSEQLKKARLESGYTQQQVADLMGITNSTYCGYETGKRQPDVEKIRLIAKLLNTSGDILLETGFDTSETEKAPAPSLRFQVTCPLADTTMMVMMIAMIYFFIMCIVF